jgi:hypothetical protein
MSRPVSIRVSYREDAAFLIRLEAAVEKDDSQSRDWRIETAQKIRELALRFLGAEVSRNKANGPSTKKS